MKKGPLANRMLTVKCLLVQAAYLMAVLWCQDIQAQSLPWQPERGIEIVVPSGPSGGNDKAARTVHAILQAKGLLSVPVNVVNRPGGGGAVAFAYLNQRPSDARYISVIPVTLLTNHITGRSTVTYTDFTAIAQLYSEYVGFAVAANSTLDGKQLIARLRQDPASIAFGFASSAGNQNHITIAMVAKAAGADVKKLKTVVFGSGGQAITALLGGHVDVSSSGASGSLPHHQSGKARIIAVAAPERIPGPLANVPTWKELGLNVVFSSWRSVIGPKGLSEAQLAYWDKVLRQMVATEEWKKDLEGNLWVEHYLGSKESKAFLDRQYADIKSIVTELGLAAQRQN
jgi:putative tricarboxylic transport membrane protein